MKYAQLRKYDVANGEGIRSTIFVTGCTHGCKGCFNREYWDFSFGREWDNEATKTIIEYLKDPQVKGLTLLGGEPMQNLELIKVLRDIKKEVDKDIWIYSGYTYEEIISNPKRLELLKECDILVDGLFVEELLNLKLKFRGSSNQRVIEIKKSLEEGKVILHDMEENLK
ncbi:MAG: anaerobic ribonucleoside-triphosphate reductase activating protein [Ezakiella sp.]|nr:anaerobic ribonucleoside-triphosphate reductase activating protein [Bacillota bacterium]MDY3947678.1 anaerobic ribonucleoside-triphosphate reductase activating protein [Ezakiella sp.]